MRCVARQTHLAGSDDVTRWRLRRWHRSIHLRLCQRRPGVVRVVRLEATESGRHERCSSNRAGGVDIALTPTSSRAHQSDRIQGDILRGRLPRPYGFSGGTFAVTNSPNATMLSSDCTRHNRQIIAASSHSNSHSTPHASAPWYPPASAALSLDRPAAMHALCQTQRRRR
jgi:hypothetical protein